MLVIGLAGLARAGKTTAAEELAGLLLNKGYNIKMMRFAGALKDASERVGAGKTLRPELYRKFCQLVGANMRDPNYCPPHTGSTYWIELLNAELQTFANNEAKRYTETSADAWRETVVLIDDARYTNELDLINKWQGNTIFVDAGYRLGLAGMQDKREDLDSPYDHESEKLALDYTYGLLPDDMFDYSISNNHEMEVFTKVLEASLDFFLTGVTICE